MLIKWIALVLVFSVNQAWAVTASETHQFHILGKVKYRCYAGYDGKKQTDELTKKPCDNKTYEGTVIDKVVTIVIKDDPDPEDSKELAGDWNGKFDFKGRQFEIAITLFKTPDPAMYRLRLVADDNEPTSRQTAVFSEMKNMKEMNPLSIEDSSVGKKEEINFWVEVKPALKK